MQTTKIKLSVQANNIIKNMPNFPLDDFLKWWEEEKMVVGGGHVVEYIDKVLSKKGD